MRAIFMIIGIEYIIIVSSQSQCKWNNLDLSNLINQTIYCEQQNDKYTLIYRPCTNGNVGCSKPCMIGQYINNGACFKNVAYYNHSLQPIYNAKQKSYTFEYKNGDKDQNSQYCYNGRYINITFVCEPNANPYDPLKVTCNDEPQYNGICPYFFNIYTTDACN
eukprot:192453_1